MLAVVTAICFTSCADDNDEGWRAVSAADYKVFTDAKVAFLNNPQNVGTPMYETLIYLTEKPQAVKAQEVEGGTNYEFYFSICNVSIAKGILDEVGYIVNTSMRSDATSQRVIGTTAIFIPNDPYIQGDFILYGAIRQGVGQTAFIQPIDATSPRRYKTMASTDGFFVSTRGGGRVPLFGLTLVSGEAAYAGFNQPGWAISAKK